MGNEAAQKRAKEYVESRRLVDDNKLYSIDDIKAELEQAYLHGFASLLSSGRLMWADENILNKNKQGPFLVAADAADILEKMDAAAMPVSVFYCADVPSNFVKLIAHSED